MIPIQPPRLIYTPNDAEYVTTYALDEEGNPTDELANYEVAEDGFYAISDKHLPQFTQYTGNGIHTQLAGVKTYCYQWADKAAYELDFPPEPIEEMLESIAVEPYFNKQEATAKATRALQYMRDKIIGSPIGNVQVGRLEDREKIQFVVANFNSLSTDGKKRWRMADNTNEWLTKQQFVDLITGYASRVDQMFDKYMDATDALESVESQEEINEILGGLFNE